MHTFEYFRKTFTGIVIQVARVTIGGVAAFTLRPNIFFRYRWREYIVIAKIKTTIGVVRLTNIVIPISIFCAPA